MTVTDEVSKPDGGDQTSGRAVPHIGAFVLETLTLGMYGEPRHTLREYVQNSFDAIRAAQRTRFLKDRGKVTISISRKQSRSSTTASAFRRTKPGRR
jgi:hypothetical protein